VTLPINMSRPARILATDTNYSTGPAAGTASKTDPGVAIAAEGFVPGRAGAQHMNFVLNDIGTIQDRLVLEARRNLAIRACKLRETATNAYADTGANLGAIALNSLGNILVLKGGANDSKSIWDDETLTTLGSIVSVTSAVKGIAKNGSGRLVAIGTGGNRCAFSADSGVTWTAGTALPADGNAIIYKTIGNRFMVTSSSGVSQDVDGASTWATVATGLSGTLGGIAACTPGGGTDFTVVPGLNGSGDLDFAVSTDGGGSWSTAGGTCPSAADYDDSGWITGKNGGSTVYHVGRLNTGDTMQVCKSTNGSTWELVATINPNTSVTARPKILMCPDTDVMWIIYDQITATGIVASFDYGVTWTTPVHVTLRSVDAFACANGRLISTQGARLQISDGVLR
jgi:hypothetical protein